MVPLCSRPTARHSPTPPHGRSAPPTRCARRVRSGLFCRCTGRPACPTSTLHPMLDPEPESELEPEPAIYRTSVRSRASTSSRTSHPLPSSSVWRKPNEVAIVAGVPAGLIVDRQLTAAFARRCQTRCIRLLFRRRSGLTFGMSRPIGDARHHGHRPAGSAMRSAGPSALNSLAKMRAVTRSAPCHRTLSSLTRT